MFFDHYPYTNFHNVNLDWVLQAVKAWGQTVEANDRAFRDLKEANEDFKKYVRNYLQDLDITDEINTKLDNMLASGILTPYFAPYVKGYVDSWLASHVTPTSPALDSTLTLSGAAARADSTGKRLKDLAYIDALSTPEVIAALNRSQVLPGYRVQGITYDYDGHYYVCGGSVDEDGTGVIVKMTKPDFSDAEISVIPQLGHANDITYYDGYLYVCTVGGGNAPQWGIYKINVNDFTDKTLISNAPENTIGISYRQGDFWILAPYRIYRTTDFTTYEVVVANTNDLLTAYGIPTSGRISQTIFRAAGYLIGWVCSFVFEDRHYGALTFFNSAGEAIAFKMFPAYHTEIQGAVYADMSIYLVADGNMVNVFRMDPRHLSYVQLKAGDDLNSFTGRGTLYSTGSNVSSELVNSPSAGEGFTVQVDRLGVYNTIQTARTNSGRELYRVKSFSAGTWGEWIEPAKEVSEIHTDVSNLYSSAVYQYAGEGKTGLFITGNATGSWGSSSRASTLVFRIPKGTKSIKVDAKTDQIAIIAFLQSYAPVLKEIPDWAVEHPARIIIPAGGSAEYDVHEDMVYMYMLVRETDLVYHTPTLTFTYPTDLPLAPLNDTSDRSTEINLLLELFGKCILTKGTYYVSGITMPDSTALIGTPNSIIRLLDSVTSGAAITMSKNSLVQGVFLEGGLSTVGSTVGTRYGIEWTGEDTVTGFVDDCIISGFDGAGILLHDTTQKVYRNLLITNCRIRTNFIGIDIKKNSEFNRITNCNITANHYGIRSRGGNNHVDNCGLDANTIGIQVDADEGTNGGHGGISNCTINHSDHNNGYGIIIRDTGRMLVTGCNLYYSKLMLDNTDGNIISACGFGQSAGWEITDGSCNMFTGCMIRSTTENPITITNNTQTKIVNCYTRDGAVVTV